MGCFGIYNGQDRVNHIYCFATIITQLPSLYQIMVIIIMVQFLAQLVKRLQIYHRLKYLSIDLDLLTFDFWVKVTKKKISISFLWLKYDLGEICEAIQDLS